MNIVHIVERSLLPNALIAEEKSIIRMVIIVSIVAVGFANPMLKRNYQKKGKMRGIGFNPQFVKVRLGVML